MSAGLPVSRLIAATVSLTALAASFANLNSLLIVGDSDVIDTDQRIRAYSSLAGVAADFGTSAQEYLAAALYFSQNPQPTQVYIGKWAQAATSGRVIGGALSATQQLLANFTAITAGSLKLAIDGAGPVTVTGLNFSAATNLNGVAAIINAALTGATCTWDGSHFIIKSTSTGASSSIGYPTAPASGTNISTVCALTLALGARAVAGIVAETALAAVTILDGLSTYWYALMFASVNIVDADRLAVAGYIEATNHIFGITTAAAAALDPTSTTDIGYLLKSAGYQRTFGQYSNTAYAAASMFGRLLTTNFNANNSVISLMYKAEPGVTAENLTTAQANALDAKRYNYFVNYNNNTAILQNGTMFGAAYIDEIYGMDWLANNIQTNVYNLLYTSTTKIPQTDAGNHQIANAIELSCSQGVTNGLLAPGTWTAGGFGQLKQNDYLQKGYYIYAPPISSQASADRAARKSVAFQVAGKLAGAVNTAAIVITLNR